MSYGLTLITPPANEPVTLSQMKQHARVLRDDEDPLLEAYVKAARGYCETYLRRQILPATWRMSLRYFPDAPIKLPLPPLQSVTSITYLDTAGVTQTLDPTKYIVDIARQPAQILPAYGECWPSTRCHPNAVNITFVAGYATVPETIKTAIKMLATHWYEHREAVTEVALNSVPMAVESLLMAESWGAI